MAEPKTNELMEKIVSLCKRRGFIFQSSDIYGGLNGFWDYGPLGAELKRNVKDFWWRSMTQERDDVIGLDASIIMHPKVWEASGHTTTFSDPMVDCLLSKKRFRADQIDPQSGDVYHYQGAVENKPMIEISQQLVRNLDEGQAVPGCEESGRDDLKEFLNEWLEGRGKFRYNERFLEPGSEKFLPCFLEAATGKEEFKVTRETYSVLIPSGKHPEYARKVARQFYQERGLDDAALLFERKEALTDTTRYNPDNGSLLTEPRLFNLMFKTYVGPVESAENMAYLRPETAQAIFAQFKNILEVSRQKVPFGIGQIGKAFRNEINPRNFTFRSREFEQMELEFFIQPDEVAQGRRPADTVTDIAAESEAIHQTPQTWWGWKEWHLYWVEQRVRWYEQVGLSRDSLELYWQKPNELAHYAKATVDILYQFPFGLQELEGVSARGDFDLTQHQKFSGKSMEYFDEETKARFVPHVIEPSAGVDRLVLALICHAFHEEQVKDDQGKTDTRIVMKFHPRIAPIKVGVFPLLKNRAELVAKARAVQDLLRPHMTVFYDESGAIGRRYRRQDEAGTPFGVTIDFDTLGESAELKDTVTLRDRDSMQQQRVPIAELTPVLQAKCK